ncbi:F-box protein interaction domain protein [Medicago truncatula]|uniref:F-box protein interaction domain protein n=1 Tax=Medicago truncatula TaxID=3880 RepID=G7IGJ8_MEDTR|nr:F-box protein interaction domain protein [Medicago truncatula]
MEKMSVYLPEEVIKEILLRLPVKTLLRCRCVCKLWLSIISHPHFSTSHFQLAASPTHKIMVFKAASAYTQPLSIDFNDDDSSYRSLSLDFKPRPTFPEIIKGSCRGFLLLLNRYDCLYLWNPTTRLKQQIPDSPKTRFFLGSYKVDDHLEPVPSSIDLKIFSLRAHKWKQIEVASHLPYIITDVYEFRPRVGSFLNGAIHWLVHNSETNRDVIIALDLKETTMSEIALPDDYNILYASRLEFDVLVLNGLIGVWVANRVTIKIWMMQEYAVHSSWTFYMHSAPQHNDFSLITCFTNYNGNGLKKFNDKGQLLEHQFYSSSYKKNVAMYTESMLSLPSGIDQA